MEQLGIQPVQLLAQILNFALLVFLLNKVLYKPIVKALEERKKKIAEGLVYSDKMKAELEKSDKKGQEVISNARDEAKKIFDEAKKSSRKMEAETLEKAQKEAAGIIEKGRKEVVAQRAEMEKQLKDETVNIAGRIVEKLLSDVLDSRGHEAIINRKIKEAVKQVRQ